ncbi:hypothetical protein [Mucilaginibacter segetis]|uniref:Uncharacterized protein n=1 Tax=Mucilaginibacter segetis TaxID=2793071 RepID=A0A934ULB8_9SPHI|nr:hypothetical protein [Mucilaginibacter segetis]MBK0378383.1 hypothetical protein [Mucilaginibacter segetis]
MKKTLFISFILFANFFLASAQQESPLIEDFVKNIKGSSAFVFNDHLNVLRVNIDNENFELLGLDDKMQVKWKTTLKGYIIDADRFKGKIAALASTEFSGMKGGSNNTYKAYMLNPENGKVLAEKIIYSASDEYMFYPKMATGEGAFFKILIRQSGIKRKLHVGLPGPLALITLNSMAKDHTETMGLEVLDLDENLDSVNSFKPAIANGNFNMGVWNNKGDMFLSWFNGPSIDLYKYPANKKEPSAQLNVSVAFKPDKLAGPDENILFIPSKLNSNVVYYSVIYKNQDNDTELGVGKFDFQNNGKDFVKEVYDKQTMKAIKKNYISINKKIDDPDMGNSGKLKILYADEYNDKLFVTLSTVNHISSSISGGWYVGQDAHIINCYDQNLKRNFQQVLPSRYIYPAQLLETGSHFQKQKLYIVANNRSGNTINGLYAVLDINTGKWEKMEILPKKHIDKTDYVEGLSILWFNNNFVIPYFSLKGLMRSKLNISLQQNTY